MFSKLKNLGLVFFVASTLIGCGGSTNEVTVSPVDDSVVHTPEQMKEMEAQYEADMKSQ